MGARNLASRGNCSRITRDGWCRTNRSWFSRLPSPQLRRPCFRFAGGRRHTAGGLHPASPEGNARERETFPAPGREARPSRSPARSRARTGAELFMLLQNARRQVHEICMDLAQAGRLEQGTPPTAEWILDNEYVIESNARDVQVNLPLQFCRAASEPEGRPLCRAAPHLRHCPRARGCHWSCAWTGRTSRRSSMRTSPRAPSPSASYGPCPRCCASR